MESAPDMDDLLDEIEESVAASAARFTKEVTHPAVVLRPPEKLHSLSNRCIPFPLTHEPVDFPPVIPSVHPTNDATSIEVTRPAVTINKEICEDISIPSTEFAPVKPMLPQHPSEPVVTASENETKAETAAAEPPPPIAHSLSDNDYDEVLRYLDAFEENEATTSGRVLHVIDNVIDDVAEPSMPSPSPSMDSTQDNSSEDSGANCSSGTVSPVPTEPDADDALLTAAVSTADDVLDSISDDVENACRAFALCGTTDEAEHYADGPTTVSDTIVPATESDVPKEEEPSAASHEIIALDDPVPVQIDTSDVDVDTVTTHENLAALDTDDNEAEVTQEIPTVISPSESEECPPEESHSVAVSLSNDVQEDSAMRMEAGACVAALPHDVDFVEVELDSQDSLLCNGGDSEDETDATRDTEEPVVEGSGCIVEEKTSSYDVDESESAVDTISHSKHEVDGSHQQQEQLSSLDNKMDEVVEIANIAEGEDEERERSSSEESAHGLVTAIECASSPNGDDEQLEASSSAMDMDDTGDVSLAHVEEVEGNCFESIATFHDLGQESDTRLTESELQLGKQKPFWIPDSDCDKCMLCSLKFSLLLRRHHCRACGRVLCGACCSEKAELEYMKEDDKKPTTARICQPCFVMLRRIEDHEAAQRSLQENNEGGPDEVTGSRSRARGVLKSRAVSLSEGVGDDRVAGPSADDGALEVAAGSQPADQKKRSVMFRDGVRPGAAQEGVEEKSTTIKPKKKSRKRHAVIRRITELRLEDELACALPTAERQSTLVIRPDGEMELVDGEWISARLRDFSSVVVVLKKNLTCTVQIVNVGTSSAWCVCSNGFAFIGLDELVFLWQAKPDEPMALPLNVLQRISQIFCSACDSDAAGVRRVSERIPSVHSVHAASYPLTRHIYFFKPTVQDVSSFPLPKVSFLVACFIHDSELPWIMACPNRVLLRLGLAQSWYPVPLVNKPDRDPVYTNETGQTVLKVFTDFRNWSYRMKHVQGCTVSLANGKTTISIPRSARKEIASIISWNRAMLAWGCDLHSTADSHLVCDEQNGAYYTQVLAKATTRDVTGTSFVIIDGALKSTTSKLQVSVVEDGIAIRLQQDKFAALVECLSSKQVHNFGVIDETDSLRIEWVSDDHNANAFSVRSDIDNKFIGLRYQYGLSLERVIMSALQVASAPDYAIRLSHVCNMTRGRLHAEEEPKVFSVAEMIARECTGYLDPYLAMLINMNINNVSVRVQANLSTVEYDVSPWLGLEDEQLQFRQSMSQLVHVFNNILQYLPNGVHLELTLSIVSTKSLPLDL